MKDFSIIKRIVNLDYVQKLLTKKNGQEFCNLVPLELKSRIGTPSVYGEVHLGKIGDLFVAVKKVQLQKKDTKGNISLQRHQFLQHESAWSEIAIFIISTIFLLTSMTQNVPLMYRYYYCQECVFENKEISKKKSRCEIVVNELAEGDLKMYLEKKYKIFTPELVSNMLFQVMSALYLFEKTLDLNHNDLHWGNILVHETIPGGYWEYIIDDTSYYVPNLGYVFVLYDFGMVDIPDKIRSDFAYRNKKGEDSDIDVVAGTVLEELLEKKMITHRHIMKYNVLFQITTNKQNENHSLGTLIKKVFIPEYKHMPKNSIITANFNMDLPNDALKQVFPKELKHLLVDRLRKSSVPSIKKTSHVKEERKRFHKLSINDLEKMLKKMFIL
jgi:hypothetical protein